MTLEKLKSRLYTKYLVDDAIADGADIKYLGHDDVPYFGHAAPDDYIVVTSDAGAVYCQYDSQPILIAVWLPDELLGCEGFDDYFVRWLRTLSL